MATDNYDFMGDWDFGETKTKAQRKEELAENRALKLYRRNMDIHMRMARDLHDLCPPPAPGEQWRIVTEYRFNAFSLVLETLESRDIEELYIAIYRINEPTVRALTRMLEDGHIKKASFVVSSFFRENHKAERWAGMLADWCRSHGNCRFAYAHNHAKVTLIRDTAGNHFVFEGSGNMADNARIEQYTYENNAEVFAFHKGWMERILANDGDKE